MRRVNVVVKISATLLVNDDSTNTDIGYVAEQAVLPALRDAANYLRKDEGVISFFVSGNVAD